MPTNGSGTGTPIAAPTFPTTVYDQMEELLFTPNCAISLARYAKLIAYEEAAFWGVVWENQYLRGCDPLWNEYERMSIQNALAEAQQEIELVIGYPLCPTYISGDYADNPHWVDQQPLRSLIVTRYPRIIAAGIPVVETLESGSAINYDDTDGLGIIGPIATTSTNASEIKIYYPDSDREITPSKITISGGEVTIEVPRYRMVKPEFLNTPEGGIDYAIIGYFLPEVDVKRIYTDPSTQAVLVRPHCRNGNCSGGCYECTRSACIYLRDPYLGVIDITPADWDADNSVWNSKVICGGSYSLVRLNYLAGIKRLDFQAEMAIVRLAHAKMGRPPCQCDKTSQMWSADYKIPDVLTRERLNCPFGLSNGAWQAYRWALSMASKRASIL